MIEGLIFLSTQRSSLNSITNNYNWKCRRRESLSRSNRILFIIIYTLLNTIVIKRRKTWAYSTYIQYLLHHQEKVGNISEHQGVEFRKIRKASPARKKVQIITSIYLESIKIPLKKLKQRLLHQCRFLTQMIRVFKNLCSI